jgi:uracil-DNA glycosylase family 4
MQMLLDLSALTLRQMVGGACQAMGLEAGEAAVVSVGGFLSRHFFDQSQRLTDALQKSNARAWKSLEVAVAGDSFWDRCKLVFASGDQKAFREQVRPLLAACPLAQEKGQDAFRQDCLKELRAAERAGLLNQGKLDPEELARRTGAFARFRQPQELLQAEYDTLDQMAGLLREMRYPALAQYLSLRPARGEPLLTLAARYFFRKCVEEDAALFQGLAFAHLEGLKTAQDAGFSALNEVLATQFDAVQKALDDLSVVVEATHEAVLDLQGEQRRQGQQVGDIYQAVIQLQGKLDLMHREVRPGDSLSIRTDTERKLVKDLVTRYRALPEAQRRNLPALLNAIGTLEVAAGEFDSARQSFTAVAALAQGDRAQAEAHHNAFRAALEQRDWPIAMGELMEAVRLDRARFLPFPIDKYVPKSILGAGGFGVAFRCQHRRLKTDVVVKTLLSEDLDREVDAVFSEAQVLRQLDHPAIIRVTDCDFADEVNERRPYLVMDYFEGRTLDAIASDKPLSPDELRPIATLMAQGLHAAHTKKILHRDVKPANILVRSEDGQAVQVKVIDFGLALRQSGRDTMRMSSTKTLLGASIAGTLEYAAPEQMGKIAGHTATPVSDIYGWARTCCFALFQTPQPLMRHWRSLPAYLADLLEACLEDRPESRPRGFDVILQRLEGSRPIPEPTTVVPEKKKELPVVDATTPVTPVEQMTANQRTTALADLAKRVADCTRCDALVKSRTRTVFGVGPLDAVLCLIGEAPAADEDRQGEPFVGASGNVLMGILKDLGVTREQVFLTNTICCRPPANRQPTALETRNCRGFLEEQLRLVRPRGIVALGTTAAQAVFQTQEPISKMRGRTYELLGGIPAVGTFHPAFVLPNRSPERRKDLLGDIEKLLRRVLGK